MTAAAVFFIAFGIGFIGFIFGLVGGKDDGLLEGESFVFGEDVSYKPEQPAPSAVYSAGFTVTAGRPSARNAA